MNVEEQLRDAFAAVDAQIDVPPLRTTSPVRRVPWLIVAASVFAVVVGVAGVLVARQDDVTTIADEPAVDFEVVTARLCQRIHDGRAGSFPRFATAEAYQVVAEQRIELLTLLRPSFETMPNAPGDSQLRGRLVGLLDLAIARAGLVVQHGVAGDAEAAAAAWRRVDELIDAAMIQLEREGVDQCGV